MCRLHRNKQMDGRRISGKIPAITLLIICISSPLTLHGTDTPIDPPDPPYTSEDLIETALKNNPELWDLRTEKEKSSLDIKKAQAGRFPDISVAANLSYIANPPTLELKPGDLGSMQTQIGTINFPQERMSVNLGAESTNYEFKLTVDQPLFTWGKIGNAVKLYKSVAEVKAISILKKEHEIHTKIRIYIPTLYFLIRIEELIGEQKQISDRLISISQQSYDNGFILYPELLDAKMKAEEITLAAMRTANEIEQMLLELEQLTGIRSIKREDINFSDVDSSLAFYTFEDQDALLKQAVENNIDLQLLQRNRMISAHKLDIAKGKHYLKPDIALHVELSYSGPRFPFIETDWFGQDDYNITSTLAIRTKIFDGGEILSDIRIQETEMEQVSYTYMHAKGTIDRTIKETLLRMKLDDSNLSYLHRRIETDKELMELKKTQFDSGVGSETDYLKANVDLLSNRIRLNQVKAQYIQRYYTIKNIVNDL